ncbi:MAG TPA: hypothetical protein VES66_02950 [Terriglobales bacterium]|nr:hypothetical protein [Terriglobales bacterium]
MRRIVLAVSVAIGLGAVIVVYVAFLAHEFVEAANQTWPWA